MSDSLQPRGLSRLFCPWDFPGKTTGVSYHSLPDPGIEAGYPALQVDSLASKPPGKLGEKGKKRLVRALLVAIERLLLTVVLGIKRGIYLFTKLESSEENLAPGMWK